jgi:hypothetical protein
MAKYKIAFNCAFKEFWRYNLYITGKLFSGDACVGFINHSDFVAEVGAELKMIPVGYKRKRTTIIEAGEGDSLLLYIYVVAHTLPTTNRIYEALPFKCQVTISDGDDVLFERQYEIDQWSGNNIEIKL